MDAFDKIVGNDDIKEQLRHILKALKDPETFDKLGPHSHSLWLLENDAYGVENMGKSLRSSE